IGIDGKRCKKMAKDGNQRCPYQKPCDFTRILFSSTQSQLVSMSELVPRLKISISLKEMKKF
ncbi:hypothetical protein KAW11_02490, partial [Candidatus Bathyarchaeota archaeon]|nr:hypothetical protein [Candidatus Bathyarchaeota archaeon]